MPSVYQVICWVPALVAAVNAQGVIQSAKGPKGPASLHLGIDLKTKDVNIIKTSEINANVVNECGRTALGGNIDIGEKTELALTAKAVTQVTAGSKVDVAINQVDANGAGPYKCDLDLKSNANGATGQTPLVVQEGKAANGVINLSVTMPKDMACIGASTGNVCTVRCFNAAAAGPFGGCFAVQQTDVVASKNTPDNINTAAALKANQAQVKQNQKDLAAASAAVAAAKTTDEQGVAIADKLLKIDSKALAVAPAAAAGIVAGGKAAKTKAKGNGQPQGATAGKKNNGAKAAAGATATDNAGGRKKNNKRRAFSFSA